MSITPKLKNTGPEPSGPTEPTLPTEPLVGTGPARVYQPSHARLFRPGFFVKLALMMAINALGVYGVLTAWWVQSWLIVATLVAGLILANWVYFSRRMLPGKYLLPGLVFLLVYQIFVMGYTAYVSFTNYGSGHNSTQADAVAAIVANGEKRAPDAPSLKSALVWDGSDIGLALVDENGKVQVGSAKHPLTPVAGAVVKAGRPVEVPGWTLMSDTEILANQAQVGQLRVPISDNPSDGAYKTQDGLKAFLVTSTFKYDEAADTITDTTTGKVYAPGEDGFYTAEDGSHLEPGWRVFVGVKNYTSAGVGSDILWPFAGSFLWSFIFAAASVLSTFALGLFFALVFHHQGVRGRRIYQAILILPYAFPGFLSTLVWRGMLNKDFGFFNQVLFGGAPIPWLEDGLLAKFSIIGVNLWLGFPYMFLVCLGAIQSLPGDVMEAAKIDGAGRWRTFRSVTLPLVLVSTTPLLISSFAFNFNNFSLIYMLTGGGPAYPGLSLPVGQTDILISMVYKIAFDAFSKNYGLASALSIIIFLVVGLISWLGFRRTKALEGL